MNTPRSVLGAIVALLVTFGAAYVGSRFPVDEWYAALAKPSWNPPNWLFGPVWSVLYLLMAISAWLVWRQEGFSNAILPLGIFILQLVLNAAWSWLFFGLHRLSLAFAEIIALWLVILVNIVLFWRVNTVSGVLLLPYLIWVTFAAFLNYTLWRLNA
ncbi:MAG: tryptophan-rich sensory protein [Chloroflexi bacterium]|nr:tryptophan-rich sensory protein [Chloroflexota bacterium]